MTRVSPGANTIEILSRPRLSQAAWLLHCRGKMIRDSAKTPMHSLSTPADGERVDSKVIYHLADSSGLHYGPAFRLVDCVTLHGGKLGKIGNAVSVDLVPPEGLARFILDPMRLDACTHGVFAALPELRAVERGVTYIPVRLDEAILHRAQSNPSRTIIEFLSKSERAIVANYYIYDATGEIAATLRGVRCQAVAARRVAAIETVALVERPNLIDGTITNVTGIGTAVPDVMAKAESLLAGNGPDLIDEGAVLLEGWAAAAAYETAIAIADEGAIDLDMLIVRGRLPASLRPWLARVLSSLEAAGLACQDNGVWILASDASLPSSAALVKAIAAEHPSMAAELLLAGAVTGFVRRVMSEHAIAGRPESGLTADAMDFYDSSEERHSNTSGILSKLLGRIDGIRLKDRALRVLQIGFCPLVESFAALRQQAEIHLTVFEPDQRRYERAEFSLSNGSQFILLGKGNIEKLGTYDLIVSAGGLHRLPTNLAVSELKHLLAPRGILIAAEPRQSLFNDLVFGLDPEWFGGEFIGRAAGPLFSIDRWRLEMDRAGFAAVDVKPIDGRSGGGSLIVAQADIAPLSATKGDLPVKPKTILIVTEIERAALASRLSEIWPQSARVLSTALMDWSELPASSPDHIIFIRSSDDICSDPVQEVTARCLEIRSCVEKIGAAPCTLWLLFFGALQSGTHASRPTEAAAWAFSRTLANEYPKIDVRRADIASGLDADVAAEAICKIVLSGTQETELCIDHDGLRAVRIESLKQATATRKQPAAESARLERHVRGRQRLAWQPSVRRRPAASEIEIEVEATGLNFRDLMWTLSMLPDEMLEGGFTGPALGLECAGRIVRVGSSVKDVKVGERVAAFAASAFSTHVTVRASHAAKLPPTITSEQAATIPVAFVTAYYSLMKLARLKKGEWILIHGAAGAVGMAAIQIAQSVGAVIVATAGAPAKRDLLRALGVPHVLDSRSTAFVDDLRKIRGEGVDVVLNSLAGEAMERSIACLRAFGRFVELGKRDYVTNTHIGLRPFRNNLSYFGVDVDQLISGRASLGAKIYAEIMRKFEKGVFTPLPYSVFEAHGIFEAFHLMQHSGHIGKIVVRPPRAGTIRAAKNPVTISASGTHVVTGAFGGFGIETVRWLVDGGARHLVLLGRRGAATPEAKALLRDLAERGVTVTAEACDVSDLRALERAFEKMRLTMPPVAGVIHTAMVLDDAIIKNLDVERFRRVLAPKVAGAENLDLVTRGQPLDYFVLFSSVTTMMGNPGQGNYVAANAYMEGLARRRRQEGLPALAIGWGPITDVGAVARSDKLQHNLRSVTGASGMRAREALDFMAQALAQASDGDHPAVITISPNEGSFRTNRLPVLRSPTYGALIDTGHDRDEVIPAGIDLRELIESEGIDVVRRKVADVVVTQLAHVLRSREEEVSRVRPLDEIGLDSLMALELVMNLEKAFAMDISLAGASAMTVLGIADEIIAHVNAPAVGLETAVATLAERHLTKVEPGQLALAEDVLEQDARKMKRLLN